MVTIFYTIIIPLNWLYFELKDFYFFILGDNYYRTKKYEEAYRRSLEDPEGFWAEVGTVVDWYKPWDKVLDDSAQPLNDW